MHLKFLWVYKSVKFFIYFECLILQKACMISSESLPQSLQVLIEDKPLLILYWELAHRWLYIKNQYFQKQASDNVIINNRSLSNLSFQSLKLEELYDFFNKKKTCFCLKENNEIIHALLNRFKYMYNVTLSRITQLSVNL